MAQSLLEDKSYVASRAWLLKHRWQRKLGHELELQTERLMPGRNGADYRADVVLQDPTDGLPVVVFEVKTPSKTMAEVKRNLKRILDTRRFIEFIGGDPTVVLLVSPEEEAEAAAVVRSLGTSDIEVEVI